MATKSIILNDRSAALAATEESVSSLIAGIKSKVSSARKADASLMVAAAYATHSVFRLNGDMKVGEFAKVTGANRTSVYLWRRLGIAVVDCGVDVDSPDWSRLASKAGANSAPVAWILDGKGRDGEGDGSILPTAEDLQWALNILFKTDDEGNLTDSKRSAADVKVALGIAEEDAPAEETAEEIARNLGKRCTVAAEYLADNLGDLSDEQYAALIPVLNRVIAAGKARDAAAAAA